MGATSRTHVASGLESTIEQKALVSFSEFFVLDKAYPEVAFEIKVVKIC